eukprot:5907938-Alexandrium_andersonii.AAC.1
MSASLVGSEMCIRDRHSPYRGGCGGGSHIALLCLLGAWLRTFPGCTSRSVSYTHLTLPTICSV